MKRRAKANVGAYPNMTEHSLKSIAGELTRARKKHPKRGDHLRLLSSYFMDLRTAMADHHAGAGPATQVQALCYTVAAMAIRIAEDGSAGFKYAGMHPNLFDDRELDFETTDNPAGQYKPVGD